MAGRPTLLTSEVQERICDYIRRGAFEWVAAESCGVSQKTFLEWIARGNGTDPDREGNALYAEFAEQVTKARAEARLNAELAISIDNPKFWLKNGPGKTRHGREGWTDETKTEVTGANGGALTVVNFTDGESAATYLRQLTKLDTSASTDTED